MANPTSSRDKEHYRKLLRSRLAASSTGDRHEWSARICNALAQWIPSLDNVRTISTYAALDTEVNLLPLQDRLQEEDYQFAYPRVAGDTLQFHLVSDPVELRPGSYGVSEPDPGLHPAANPGQLDLCLCPGLSFTPEGIRLGRGRAYYDSVLSLLPSSTFRIGIGFELQVEDWLPCEAHDGLMSHLGTEAGIRPTQEASS